jgi:hypothetical protein
MSSTAVGPILATGSLLALLALTPSCEDGGNGLLDSDADSDTDSDADSDTDSDSDADADTDSDSDSDADTDSDADSDTDSDADSDDLPDCVDLDSDWWCADFDCDDDNPLIHPNASEDPYNGFDDDCDGVTDEESATGAETVTGTVYAPNGTIPISGALVYLSEDLPAEFPSSVFCDECADLAGIPWALSGPDGSFTIDNAPIGTKYLVVRKGLFQRIREITVAAGVPYAVPADHSTLPGEDSSTGYLDQIPTFGVLYTEPDRTYLLLTKLGMADFSGSDLSWGSESFLIYNNSLSHSGYPATTSMFASQATLDSHHMIFLPCYASSTGTTFVANNETMIRNYVSAGGKIYNSCCVAQWIERPFPAYIDFYGSDTGTNWDIGRYWSTAHSTTGNIVDPGLASWIDAVTAYTPSSFPFTLGYAKVDALISVADGHGLPEDGGVVIPYSWVNGAASDVWSGSPLMMTYSYDCGKVFYSVYETTGTGTAFTAQEYVLLYIILEIGVCENDLIVG